MKLCDFVVQSAVNPDIPVGSKESAIRSMYQQKDAWCAAQPHPDRSPWNQALRV